MYCINLLFSLSREWEQIRQIELAIRRRHLHLNALQHKGMKHTISTEANASEVILLCDIRLSQIMQQQLHAASGEEGVVGIGTFINRKRVHTLDSRLNQLFKLLEMLLLVKTELSEHRLNKALNVLIASRVQRNRVSDQSAEVALVAATGTISLVEEDDVGALEELLGKGL